MPASGPSREAVVDVGTQPNAPYVLVQISDFVLENFTRFPGPSLVSRFGDYRGPVEQRIGVGDTVGVTIFEAANGGLFSQAVTNQNSTGSHSAVIPSQVVARDGSITVPYAGRVRVVGQTPPQVENTIVKLLTGKAIEPQAIVTLSGNISNAITVNGEVVKGSRVPLSARGDRILDVIATAGGINSAVYETFIELTRNGRTVRVPMQALLSDPRENIYMRPADVLTVVRYPLSFTAVGATGRNSVVPFDAKGISLEEAIGKAAGFVDERADPEGVFVLRYESIQVARDYPTLTPALAENGPLVPVAYMINMREPASLFLARRFAIHDKDIIFVSNSPFNDIQKLLSLFGSLTAPAIQGVSVAK